MAVDNQSAVAMHLEALTKAEKACQLAQGYAANLLAEEAYKDASEWLKTNNIAYCWSARVNRFILQRYKIIHAGFDEQHHDCWTLVDLETGEPAKDASNRPFLLKMPMTSKAMRRQANLACEMLNLRAIGVEL